MAARARRARDGVISVTISVTLLGWCGVRETTYSRRHKGARTWSRCRSKAKATHSFWIWWACWQRTMSYLMSKIWWKVRRLRWNHEPWFIDLDSEHLNPVTFFRHRHVYCSGIVDSANHFISWPHVLHCTLLRSRPTTVRNCIAKPWSQNTYVRKFLLGPPPSRSIGRPYEDLGTNGISCRRFSYSFTTSQIFSSIVRWNETHASTHDDFGAKTGCYTGTGIV